MQALIDNLTRELRESDLNKDIVCLLWYGSSRDRGDFRAGISDHDFHLVLANLRSDTLLKVKRLFVPYERIDLSVHCLDEIISTEGRVLFQNGTQGAYFIHILARADVLIGRNIYVRLARDLSGQEVDDSLRFKVKEYMWRLRRMFVSGDVDLREFRKYSVRLLADILLLRGLVDYDDLPKLGIQKITESILGLRCPFLDGDEIRSLRALDGTVALVPDFLSEVIHVISKIVSANV